ncbi:MULTISPECIES: glycosyltransferase family 4 protein [Bacteroides]|uniref:glycosyltransferase family 4 protein n=1 Tax=Bacteroides TaxID=816 RepID=UPI00033F9A1C|nr:MULTISPECIES: glycosyltransferase [Bacteroides]UYU46500.1 glycosyltransferase [Bacteroides salyersiae]CCY49856.1 glycosyltransferase group 1 family protein [Bacteroides sp. CAG:189]
MTIVFVSNFFNHHEKFFCDELNKMGGVEFHFIQTVQMNEERVKLGWGIDITTIPYCICSYGYNGEHENALKLCEEADVVILGSAPYEFIAERVKQNRLTFFYAERLFRNGLWHMFYPPTFFTVLKRFILPGRKSNFYLLCASGYTAIDTANIFAFNNHRFKWGHFIEVAYPEGRKQKVDDGRLHLLWAGRFLELKHPDYPIRIANTLKQKNISFVLDIIGSGEQEVNMRKLISDFKLEDHVVIHGTMRPTEVRQYMEKADIYMFTSDFNEGWGAVLGESMVSGCAVVTSHGIGATPFLVQHDVNGLVYETANYGSFERNVLKLINSKELRTRLSKRAIETMLKIWNPKVGAERFYSLAENILTHGVPIFYDQGPISKAEVLHNNWFKDDTI